MENKTAKWNWLPYAASVQGTKHIRRGMRSEDACATLAYQGGGHVYTSACQADGMSDSRAPYAFIGAAVFAQAAAQYLTRNFEQLWACSEQELAAMTIDFRQKSLRLLQAAAEHQTELQLPPVLAENPGTGEKNLILTANLIQYATTLQGTAVSDDGRLLVMTIGDGGCLVQAGSEMVSLNKPPKQFMRGTAHITFGGIGDVIKNLVWHRIWLPEEACGVFLCSDGGKFSGGLYDGETMQAEKTMFEISAMLNQSDIPDLEGTLKIRARLEELREDPGNDQGDDITLSALIRPGPVKKLTVPAKQLIEQGTLYARRAAPVQPGAKAGRQAHKNWKGRKNK